MTSESLELPETQFHDLDHFIAIPRLGSLVLSPDGTRLVTSVATLNAKSTEYSTALWELDPAGEKPAARITRSAKGEAGASFLASGDLLFTSARPNPDRDDDQEATTALWRLPSQGGEARMVLSRPGGINGVLTPSDADSAVLVAEVLPGSADETDDGERRTLRKDTNVGAILHSGYPVRYWDADLGPAEPRYFAMEEQAASGRRPTVDAETPLQLRDITGGAGATLRNATAVISPDGSVVVTSLSIPMGRGDGRSVLARIDVATGQRTVLLDDPGYDLSPGPISPDGSTLVVHLSRRTTAEITPQQTVALLSVAGGELTPLAEGWDRWPSPSVWLPDGSAVLVTADEEGASPVFLIDVAAGAVTRVTTDAASYTNVVVSPDGGTAYALRSSYEFPAEVVRIDLAGRKVVTLPGPVDRPALPGRLERVETTADDGQEIGSWLVLPGGADASNPAPLLLWIHGGPLGSWNAWSWRWSPWLLAARGYAVLLPDPALSTGYGQRMIDRGWGQWGKAPFTDLMRATDDVVTRRDIDETRTAAMGGSFGGYMANWIAGHTDRFDAVVTHASLWALDQFGPTTDASYYWEKEMTPEMAAENSPHHHVENISTPMLVIHGDKDYRVPIGEGLRLWYELLSRSQLAADENGRTEHRFLYFPDENHWILKPQHAKVWYSVVEHFLALHVLGSTTDLPPELGL
ncbi:prolyl oligopeptidase family serine peptidase [Arthrobacter sp. H20]|uniref:prolyl oligopeptidase family serine peptidase n=1 Tax=Arthrobacter sp. H20 TaxID=1267981 RepID=UPI00047ABDE3|nr:prolyl oligopeptidase family serine peptidase [Arthrobacter sp. H20]